MDQRAGDLGPAAVAAIEVPRLLVRPLAHVEAVERGIDPRVDRAPRKAVERPEIPQVLPHRQIEVQRRLLENHAKPLEGDETIEPPSDAPEDPDGYEPLTIPEREVTSILVRNGNPMFGPGLQNKVNESLRAQAAAPVGEISKLMDAIIGPMLAALLVITLITCVVAAVGVLVAIYNSMNDRRRDIAVMRALGARRETVTGVILLESILIAVIGAVSGWFLAHAAIWFFSGEIEDRTGVQVGILTTSSYEGWIFPLVLILAGLAGLLPAWSAYRTDVGSNLSA